MLLYCILYETKDSLACLAAEACPGAVSGWISIRAEDGSTAADFAKLTGAQDINTDMASKLAGNALEAEESGYRFNPETGELVEDEDTDVPSVAMETVPLASSEQQNQPPPASPMYLDPSAVQGTKLHLMEESSKDALSSSASNTELFEESKTSREATGLHHRKKGFKNSFKGDNDMYLGNKEHSLKPPPHVFDRQAAVLSSVVIGVVGCLALGLRYCLDSSGLEYWGT